VPLTSEREGVVGEEGASIVSELHERKQLLERISELQRAIVERRPLHRVLQDVVDGAHELLDVDATGLRLRDPDDREHTVLIAYRGAGEALLNSSRRANAGEGLGGRAMQYRELVLSKAGNDRTPDDLVAELSTPGLTVAMAAPVCEGPAVAGSLVVGSRDPAREFTRRDQQVLLALSEHASLALGHSRAVEAAMEEAFRDSLTGMPNRALFLDRLGVALARAERTGTPVAVLFCDLDGFQTVNDSLGHQAGDRLLVLVAERLRESLRPEDTLARLGGDEFAVLLEQLEEPEDSARAARAILAALEEPFELSDREIYVGASIGIAAGTGEPHTLLRDADLAMYRVKAEGKGGYAAYEPQMHTAVVDRLELELDLKRAIGRGEFVLDYQPIFDLRGGSIAGLEALVRWRHPRRGLLRPARFVPLAEESGEIAALGRWVLRTACHQAALWQGRHPTLAGFQIAVNISAVQLRDPPFADEVRTTLAAAELDPERLTLEITESALMEDTEIAVRRLHELKALGVELAIDDFGTGYSSLTHLQRFPLDNLKIDRDFVARGAGADREPALLRAIVELAEIFKLTPVAEGIEQEEEVDRLLELGCVLGQGHLLSEPLHAAEADAFLEEAGLSAAGAR
jgi:diguanylate cyclase (GGDEF)-like protein